MRVSKNNSVSLKFEIICVALALVGVVAGTLCCISDLKLSVFDSVFSGPFEKLNFINGDVFLKYIIYNSSVLLCVLLCGLSAVFQPIIIISCAFVGVGYGYSISQIYVADNKNSILFALLTLIIPAVITVFSLIIAWREAFYMSVSIATAIFSSKNFIGFKDAVRIYLVKFIVLEAIIAVSALVRCLFYSFF